MTGTSAYETLAHDLLSTWFVSPGPASLRRFFSYFALTFLLLGLVVGGVCLVVVRSENSRLGPKIEVDGVPLTDDTHALETVQTRADARLRERLTVSVDEVSVEGTLAEWGIGIDVAATTREARAAAGRPLGERLRTVRDTVRVPLRFSVAPNGAKLLELEAAVRREPADARLDLENRALVPDVEGRELDVSATIEHVLVALGTHQPKAAAEVRRARAAVAKDDLGKVDLSKTLSTFTTTFPIGGSNTGRANNVAVAARKLDGALLLPGTTVSFDATVGPRTIERGFAHAPEIVGDELEDGVGGGTCQVASTLHAASLFGALDVVERHAHARASAYTKPGLDATVVYGVVDLKVRNPHPFALVVHAHVPKPGTLEIVLLGGEPSVKVVYTYSSRPTGAPFRRITHKPYLPKGAVISRQKGKAGATVISYVKNVHPDGHAVERSYASEYRTVPEVFWVGSDADESALPPPADDITHVERRGPSAPAAPVAVAPSG